MYAIVGTVLKTDNCKLDINCKLDADLRAAKAGATNSASQTYVKMYFVLLHVDLTQ